MADEQFDPVEVIDEILNTFEVWEAAVAEYTDPDQTSPVIHYLLSNPKVPVPLSQNNTEDEKQIQFIHPLDLYRVAVRNDNTLSWFDCFLFQMSEQYRLLRFETQLKIQRAFRGYCKDRIEDIHDAFPKEWSEQFELDASIAQLYEDEPVISHNLAFILGWFFGVVTIILELEQGDDDSFIPVPIAKTFYQSAECPVIVMIGYEGRTYEPLVELVKEPDETIIIRPLFTWDNPVLCELKSIANQIPEVFEAEDVPEHFELWTEPSCEEGYTVPTLKPKGIPLDSWEKIDLWIQAFVARKKLKLEAKERTTPIKKASPYFLAALTGTDALTKQQQAEITAHRWHTIHTAGDGTCFLHAALQAISPTYRRLSEADRSTVGKGFRTLEFLKLFNDLSDLSLVANTRLFLEERQIRAFLKQYNLNALVVTRDLGGVRLTPFVSEEKALNGFPWIFMYNSDQSHYSTIAVTYKGTARLMLTEPEYLEDYTAITKGWVRDSQFTAIRSNLVKEIEAANADSDTKQAIRSNIFRHELDAKKASENAGLLPGKLDDYESTLGLKKGALTRFKKPFANLAAQKGGHKTRRIQRAVKKTA
jgi:hypothetical protein